MKLHPKATQTYTVLEESEWTELDKEIWENFDDTMQDLCWGQISVPDERYAIGRDGEYPVVFSEVVYAKSCHPDGSEDRFYPNELDSVFTVCTSAYLYESVEDGRIQTGVCTPIFFYEQFFEKDRDYDFLTEIIPSENIDYIKDIINSLIDKFECYELFNYINKKIGEIGNIKDPVVKELISVELAYNNEEGEILDILKFSITSEKFSQKSIVRIRQSNGYYLYDWIRVDDDDGEFNYSQRFAYSKKELSALQLKEKLDESNWLDLKFALPDPKFKTPQEIANNLVELESSIIKKEWLLEWLQRFCDKKQTKQ
ncbi:hypothetical protein N8697_00950 [bacterium]|nr:hypothetical protein [bacterium]